MILRELIKEHRDAIATVLDAGNVNDVYGIILERTAHDDERPVTIDAMAMKELLEQIVSELAEIGVFVEMFEGAARREILLLVTEALYKTADDTEALQEGWRPPVGRVFWVSSR